MPLLVPTLASPVGAAKLVNFPPAAKPPPNPPPNTEPPKTLFMAVPAVPNGDGSIALKPDDEVL